MRTAKFLVSDHLLFELLGLKFFEGEIVEAGIIDGALVFQVRGNDSRLPDKDNYPHCHLIAQTVTSRFEEV